MPTKKKNRKKKEKLNKSAPHVSAARVYLQRGRCNKHTPTRHGELTPWESPGESMYDVMPQEWRDLPPLGSVSRQPLSLQPPQNSRRRTVTMNDPTTTTRPRRRDSPLPSSLLTASLGASSCECIGVQMRRARARAIRSA